MKLIMTGHYAGKTVTLNTYTFINGELELGKDISKLDGLVKYFASYNAFLAGSSELEAAQERDRQMKESNHGASEILDGHTGQKPGGVQSNEPGTGAPGSDGTVAGDAGSNGVVSGGGGVPEGRVVTPLDTSDPKMLMIIDALKVLDPTRDDHWTDAGLPLVAAVAELSKVADVTRADIEKAIPGWNREAALASV